MQLFIIFFVVAQITRGPYLSWESRPDSTITVSWNTSADDSSIVAYGFSDFTDTLKNGSLVSQHSLMLEGLAPGTTYVYKIIGTGYESNTHSFKTAPSGQKRMYCIIFGDNRSDSVPHQMVVDSIIGRDPDWVINTGDLVNEANNQGDWDTFFNIERELLSQGAYMPCIGNHEVAIDLDPFHFYTDIFYLPQTPGNEEYYSYKCGNIYFIVLNTKIDYLPLDDQTEFIESELELATADPDNWIVVYLHRPPYCAGGAHESATDVRDAWCPLLEAYQVDLVFAGHNHFYQRIEPINGVNYIITGGGGAPLYDPDTTDPDFEVAYTEKCYHFCELIVNGTKLLMRVIRADDGAVIDSLRLSKPGVEEEGSRLQVASCKLEVYPNPFTQKTEVRFQIPDVKYQNPNIQHLTSDISLKIYDLSGRIVKTLLNTEKEAGKYNVGFDAKRLTSGIYFVKLVVGDYKSTRKLILVR